jgi:signal transduction protein with GAF and PtsI domain
VAIENARLYEAGLLTRSRQERLQVVTDVALAHPDLHDLLSVLLPRIRELLAADTCVLYLLDEDTNDLVVRAGVGEGIEDALHRIHTPVGEGVVGLVAADGRPVVIADTDQAVDLNPMVRKRA